MSKRVLIPYRNLKKLAPYVAAVQAAGLDAVPAYVAEPVSLETVDGLLLMGGTDVNPLRYGATAQPETDEPDDTRDQRELDLIASALEKDLPVLAICRGLQILNVSLGGTLVQHVASPAHHDVDTVNKGAVAHEVLIEPDSLLAQIAGVRRWQVNSRHHQAVDRVGSSLRVVARDAEDGTVEGVENPAKRFVLGVQWHPEDQLIEMPEQLKLFQRFADAL